MTTNAIEDYYSNYPELEDLRRVFSYDPESGIVIRLESVHARFVGEPVGGRTKEGYIRTSLDGAEMRVHSLAWILYHGRLPDAGCTIDHINGVRDDNRIANLRMVPIREQTHNLDIHRDGKLYGCTFDKDIGRWVAKIHRALGNGKNRMVFLGYYDTEDEAHNAYLLAAKDVDQTFKDAEKRAEARRQAHQSGLGGVKWSKFHDKWTVSVSVERHNHHCGYFDDAEEAQKVFMFIDPIKREFVEWLKKTKEETGAKSLRGGAAKFMAQFNSPPSNP
jgi:hypothetical protein